MLPIPAAERSKTFFCGRSLAGIAVSNPVGGMDVCLSVVSVVCCQVEASASGSNKLCALIAEDGGGRQENVARSVRCYTFFFFDGDVCLCLLVICHSSTGLFLYQNNCEINLSDFVNLICAFIF